MPTACRSGRNAGHKAAPRIVESRDSFRDTADKLRGAMQHR
eukprot:SAG31_NODE_41472_length_276_cov_0.576271_1_plen_40_part_10